MINIRYYGNTTAIQKSIPHGKRYKSHRVAPLAGHLYIHPLSQLSQNFCLFFEVQCVLFQKTYYNQRWEGWVGLITKVRGKDGLLRIVITLSLMRSYDKQSPYPWWGPTTDSHPILDEVLRQTVTLSLMRS